MMLLLIANIISVSLKNLFMCTRMMYLRRRMRSYIGGWQNWSSNSICHTSTKNNILIIAKYLTSACIHNDLRKYRHDVKRRAAMIHSVCVTHRIFFSHRPFTSVGNPSCISGACACNATNARRLGLFVRAYFARASVEFENADLSVVLSRICMRMQSFSVDAPSRC